MAVVCLMIQNLISIHVPDLDIEKTEESLIINGNPIDLSAVPAEYLTIGK